MSHFGCNSPQIHVLAHISVSGGALVFYKTENSTRRKERKHRTLSNPHRVPKMLIAFVLWIRKLHTGNVFTFHHEVQDRFTAYEFIGWNK